MAVVETPQENEFLAAKLKLEAANVKSRWMGAISRHSRWQWNQSNGTFEEGFTDWKPNQAVIHNSACLLVTGEEADGFYWERESCINWRHFICEIPSQADGAGSSSLSTKSVNYLGDTECQENTYKFDGFATTVKNCFHLVKLQYSFAKAQKFCQERFGESIAELDATQEKNFLPLIKKNLGERTKVNYAVSILRFI